MFGYMLNQTPRLRCLFMCINSALSLHNVKSVITKSIYNVASLSLCDTYTNDIFRMRVFNSSLPYSSTGFIKHDYKRKVVCLFFAVLVSGKPFVGSAHRGSTVGFLLLQYSNGVVRHPRDLQVSVATHFCRVLIFASS